MARAIPLLEHGTALGDTVNYMSTIVKSGQQRTRGLIEPGQCGFRGCNEDRIGGIWKEGGSYMCPAHKALLLPMRLKPREGLSQREKAEALAAREKEVA